jgi:F-type H+-transporting ATPase subunit delta
LRGMAIARRYAKGLVDLAVDAREVPKLFADMIVMQEVAHGSPHFIEALADERIRLSKRVEAAKRIIQELKLTKLTGNAILLLMQKGRIALIPFIAKSVLKNIRTRKQLTVAKAQVADRAEANEVGARIEKVLSEILGMTVECEVGVDPTLMGGFVVEVGDARFDTSIKGKLTRMKEEFFSEEKGL